jgi:hypothetical protein
VGSYRPMGQVSQQQSIYNQVVHLTVSFRLPSPVSRLNGQSVIQGVLRYAFKIASGEIAYIWLEMANNTSTDIAGEGQDRICPCAVGSTHSGGAYCGGRR